MKINLDDKFWLVLNPTAVSEFVDICCETTLKEFIFQCKGGLFPNDNPTIFTDEDEAKKEAQNRLDMRDKGTKKCPHCRKFILEDC